MREKRQNRKGAWRRILSPLLTLALTAGMALTASPSGGEALAVELNRECSLQVAPITEGGSPAEGQPGEKVDVTIDLYQVARAQEVDGYDTYDYHIDTDSPYYAGIAAYVSAREGEGWESEQDAEGLNFRYRPREAEENAGWAGLAQEAASLTLKGDAAVPVSAAGEAGSRITGLEAGLYLIIARGSSLTEKEDYVTAIETEEGGEETATVAYSQEYVYSFIPQLVSLPGKEPEAGIISTAGAGEWLYDLTGAELKPTVGPRYTGLEIVKVLEGYASPASFVFQVEASQNGRVIYSDVVTLSFDGTSGSTKSILLEDKIPAGADVTVTEVYSGAGYDLTGVTAGPGAGEIQEGTGYNTNPAAAMAVITSIGPERAEGEAAARVTFTNSYNGSGNNGGAITNHFEREEEEADWSWNQYRYDPAAGSWGWNPALPAVTDTTAR